MKSPYLIASVAVLLVSMSLVAQTTGTFTDSRDGKVYKTVTVNAQTWMAENLAYKAGSGCWAYNNDENNVKDYGYLFSWEIAKQAAPAGWHLPTKEELSKLIDYLGGESVAGDKLKEAGTKHWYKTMPSVTNETNFGALPGGYRNEKGEFYALGLYGGYWCSTLEDSDRAHFILIYTNTTRVDISYVDKNLGYSVRCIKD